MPIFAVPVLAGLRTNTGESSSGLEGARNIFLKVLALRPRPTRCKSFCMINRLAVRRLFSFGAQLAIVGGLTIAGATSAQAATPLAVDVKCESFGHSKIRCARIVTGGVGPFGTRWFYNGNQVPGIDDRTAFTFSCSTAKLNNYSATVTDSVGATATDVGSAKCITGNP